MKKIRACACLFLILFAGSVWAQSNKDLVAELYLSNVRSANRVLCATVAKDDALVATSPSTLSDNFSTLADASRALADYAVYYKYIDSAMKRYTESDEYIRYDSVIIAEFKKAEAFKARMPNLLKQIDNFLLVMRDGRNEVVEPVFNEGDVVLRTSRDIYAHAHFACERLKVALDNYRPAK